MGITENPCVIVGPIGYHRLAQLLFDCPVHFLLTGPGLNESDEVASFQKLISELPESKENNSKPEISIIEIKPKVYTIESSTGIVDAFGPEEISREGDVLHPLVSIASAPIIGSVHKLIAILKLCLN